APSAMSQTSSRATYANQPSPRSRGATASREATARQANRHPPSHEVTARQANFVASDLNDGSDEVKPPIKTRQHEGNARHPTGLCHGRATPWRAPNAQHPVPDL